MSSKFISKKIRAIELFKEAKEHLAEGLELLDEYDPSLHEKMANDGAIAMESLDKLIHPEDEPSLNLEDEEDEDLDEIDEDDEDIDEEDE